MKIDRQNLPMLSDEQVEAAGAFLRDVKGETLLLMTPAFGRSRFPDWSSLSKTVEFRQLNKASENGRGRGYHCRIRHNSKSEWFYAFRLT
jgi:hypothetical protein